MDTSKTAKTSADDDFSRDITGLAAATVTQTIDLADGDRYELVAAPVRKRLGDAEVRLLAYNGSVPGPTLRVRQGSSVTVTFTNQTDLDSTVHWHGLRVDNRYDGTHETQAPVPVGGSFTYRLQFPDPGIYWYHPHIREDYGQELGLYGTILVVPADADYWPPVHREVVLTLDDILVEEGQVAAFRRSQTTHAAMGRFGNVLLVGGEPAPALAAQRGEVVRFYLTNTANTRVFNVALPGARLKLVGGDSGRCEREEVVETVLLAPSERVVVDVLFDTPGPVTLEHHTPDRSYRLATIAVSEEPALPSLADEFAVLRHNAELVAERQHLGLYLAAAPDKTLAFVAEMSLGDPAGAAGPVVYTCPMHPEVVSQAPGRCPDCGMALVVTTVPDAATSYTCPMHPEVVSAEPGRCPACGMKLLPSQPSGQAARGSGRHAADHAAETPDHSRVSDRVPDVAAIYTCPMHPEVVSQAPGRCPECGMALVATAVPDVAMTYTCPMHPEVVSAAPGRCPACGMKLLPFQPSDQAAPGSQHHAAADHAAGTPAPTTHRAGHAHGASAGIEWEDDMVAVNRMTTPANTRWLLVDRATGAENHAIAWRFRVGERVKIRLVNELDSDHPMHHPFHIHGAGRFLVLSRDGVVEPNLMWKDTVLVRTGQTVDILLDVTNPGVWMAHCHIAEHHESGMMFSFHVVE